MIKLKTGATTYSSTASVEEAQTAGEFPQIQVVAINRAQKTMKSSLTSNNKNKKCHPNTMIMQQNQVRKTWANSRWSNTLRRKENRRKNKKKSQVKSQITTTHTSSANFYTTLKWHIVTFIAIQWKCTSTIGCIILIGKIMDTTYWKRSTKMQRIAQKRS